MDLAEWGVAKNSNILIESLPSICLEKLGNKAGNQGWWRIRENNGKKRPNQKDF